MAATARATATATATTTTTRTTTTTTRTTTTTMTLCRGTLLGPPPTGHVRRFIDSGVFVLPVGGPSRSLLEVRGAPWVALPALICSFEADLLVGVVRFFASQPATGVAGAGAAAAATIIFSISFRRVAGAAAAGGKSS